MRKPFCILLVLLFSCFLFASDLYTVEDLLSFMEVNSTDVRKAREEVKKAALDISDAKASYYPTVDLTLTGSYIANPMEAIRINPADYINIPNVATGGYVTLYKGQENTYYQFKLELVQPIYTSGKIPSAVRLAKQAYEARVLALEKAVEDNAVKVKAQSAALYFLNELLTVVSETSELSDRLVKISCSAFENGLMLESDYKSIVAKARATDSAKAQIQAQILSLEAEISALCGLDEFSASSLSFSEKEIESLYEKLDIYSYEDLKNMAVSGERTVFRLMTTLEIISQEARKLSSASVSWKPDVALVVDFDYSGSRFPLIETDWYRQNDWGATVTVAVKTTLFDAGSSGRAVKRAIADASEAEIDFSSARSQVISSLAENFGSYISSQAEISYQKALYESDLSIRDIKESLMGSGYGSESDYVQSLIDLSICRSDLIRAEMNRAIAAYTVSYLCGL